MNYTRERIIYLLDRLGAATASPAELAEIETISQQLNENEQLRQEVTALFVEMEPLYPGDAVRNRILERVFAAGELSEEEAYSHQPTAMVRVLTNHKRTLKRIAVAASIILFISFGLYVISTKEKSPAVVVSPHQQHDVPAPDKNRAQIQLSDGTIVYLDSAANGQLATQSNVIVTKTADGQIIYTTPSAVTTPTAVDYNTLSNPRGSIVMHMTLSDGSKVWLNAGSSITYPVAFINYERKVSMTGEGYFEVAKDPTKKFIVEANGTTTEVLGTHFNINAYDDEADIKVTLLEGSVTVGSSLRGTKQSILKPNQQAVIAKNEAISINNNADLDAVMSWKNGLFNFNNADLQTVLRQLARWYDVTVVYEGNIPKRNFGGEMQRNMSLAEVLKILEKNNVHFSIQDKTLKVKP